MAATPFPHRNLTLDVAKGLGILLVVLGHNNGLVLDDKGEAYRVIFSFHVPLFLLLSGVFLKTTEPLGSLLKSKADALLKPYLVVLVALGVAKALFNPSGALTYFAGLFYAAGDTLSWVPMWFLPHLFLALVLSWALLRGASAVRLPAWALVPVLWAFGVWSLGWFFGLPLSAAAARVLGTPVLPGLPLNADLLPLSAAFLITGHLLHARLKTLRFPPLLFGLALAVFVALHLGWDLSLDLNMRRYDDVVVSTVEIVTGVVAVLCLSAGLARLAVGRLLAHIGSASLFILMFHMVVQDRVFLLLERLSAWPQANAVAAFVLGVAVPMVMLALVRRQPWLARWLLPLPRAATPSAGPPPLAASAPARGT
ncbi:MAG: acyltransferase family protein [Pseudomonadota bacterium]